MKSARGQIIIIGLVAFACPGLFNALSGLGKAGGSNAQAANAAHAALYGCFALFGYFGGALFPIFGGRILMFVGGLTYACYAAGIFLAGNVAGLGWLAILCGVLVGIGAALFWTAQGTLMLAYSTEATRGQYIGLFWVIFNLGAMAGGIISFAINFNATSASQASPSSYFTFVTLMVLGAFVSLFFMESPENVVRADGSGVIVPEQRPFVKEIKGVFRVLKDPIMQILFIFFLATIWNYTYNFNFINGSLFNIRTRGINSAIFWAMQMIAATISGWLMDLRDRDKRQRGILGYIFVCASMATGWGLAFAVQITSQVDKSNPIKDPIDFTDRRAFLPTLALVFLGLGDAATQSFAYWIMGAFAGNDVTRIANYAGFYKGIQSVGAAAAWGLDLSPTVTYMTQLIIGSSLWALGTAIAFFAVARLDSDKELLLPTGYIISTSEGPNGIRPSDQKTC